MKSISGKVLCGAVAALLISLATFLLIGDQVVGSHIRTVLTRFSDLELHDAIKAYEAGGADALRSYIDNLGRFVPATYTLTDAEGLDLSTGANKSALARSMGNAIQWNSVAGDRLTVGVASPDKRYRWFIFLARPFSPTDLLPFCVLLAVIFAGLYWFVSLQVTRPLTRLTEIVDLFGRGDLSARVASDRPDEIGRLARSFNEMANRIETLLSAERQLLLDVSHELRSPLARLTFAAEMVRKTDDRDAAVARMRREIDRLSELVRTLIDVTRAEGDPHAVQGMNIDLAELARSVIDDCSIEAGERHCSIRLSEAGNAVRITGDRELLRRAIENVIRNAIRYSPRGTAVDIRLSAENGQAITMVRDYGPGVPLELLDKIFRPFFRVDTARQESTGGIGMGLAIARRAVLAHNGVITAENAYPGLLVRISVPESLHATCKKG